MAVRAGDPDAARRLYEESIELYEQQGDTHAAARVLCRLGEVEAVTGRRDEAMARTERAFAVISTTSRTRISRCWPRVLPSRYWFGGDLERAAERAELALDIAEAHAYPEPLDARAARKGGHRQQPGTLEETGGAAHPRPRDRARARLTSEAGICYFWLSDRCFQRDEYAEALGYLDEALALARKIGSRPQEWAVLAERTYPLFMLGRWDEAQATRRSSPRSRSTPAGRC